MKKDNKLSLVFGYLALTSGSIWLGAYIARLLTTYQMFEATDLALKSFISNENLPAIFQFTIPLIVLTFTSYLLLVITFSVFLITTKTRLKENGWLMIISLIIYLTLPLEAVLLFTDYELISLFIENQYASVKILNLIKERITLLSSFPIILILSYLTIPYFLVFKPFTISLKNEN